MTGAADERQHLDNLLDELSKDEIAGLVSALEEHVQKGRVDCVRAKQGSKSVGPVRKQEPHRTGYFQTFVILPGRKFPGFATAGDELVCKLWGVGSDLPRKTPSARRRGLVGRWWVINRHSDNARYSAGKAVTIRIDGFGSSRLRGGLWDEGAGVFDEARSLMRCPNDSVYEVISVHREKGRRPQGDTDFCDALQRCGFSRAELERH